MYNPTHFKITDQEPILKFISEYPLATIVTAVNGSLNTSYIPIIAEMIDNKVSLFGHMARANSHWKEFTNNSTLLSFRGPDRYISPIRYVNKINVPTWNYTVVEARGCFQVIQDATEIEQILQKSVRVFEEADQSLWQYDLPEDFRQSLVKGIVGLRMTVESLEGKFKLGSNRSAEDYQALWASLEASALHSDHAMLKWIKPKS